MGFVPSELIIDRKASLLDPSEKCRRGLQISAAESAASWRHSDSETSRASEHKMLTVPGGN